MDDESIFLDSLSECLLNSDKDLCILTAEDGLKALKILESEQVELVVTDLNMPFMDGYQLAAFLKRNYPDTPVMAMSAVITAETERMLAVLGISQWFEKSLNVKELVSKISMEAESKKEGGGV